MCKLLTLVQKLWKSMLRRKRAGVNFCNIVTPRRGVRGTKQDDKSFNHSCSLFSLGQGWYTKKLVASKHLVKANIHKRDTRGRYKHKSTCKPIYRERSIRLRACSLDQDITSFSRRMRGNHDWYNQRLIRYGGIHKLFIYIALYLLSKTAVSFRWGS